MFSARVDRGPARRALDPPTAQAGPLGPDSASLLPAAEPFDGTSNILPACPATHGEWTQTMLKVTYIDFHEKPGRAACTGWYITDANGAIIAGAHRYTDQASGLRASMALS